MANEDGFASPADDGGHQGSFTVPEDELTFDDEPGPHPPTDQDPARPNDMGNTGAVLGWGVAFALVVLFFVALNTC